MCFTNDDEGGRVCALNLGSYPYRDLIKLYVKMDYDGWVLLECRTKPKDRIAALVEQRKVFEQMVAVAQG